MIEAKDFCDTLLASGYDYFTGVPCGFFKGLIHYSQSTSRMKYIIAANEGAALGLASGADLAGRKPAVLIQNSGLGNMVNPLTSLNAIYDIPALLLISGRGYGAEDEPQHAIMGRCMNDLLATIGIRHADAAQDLGAFRRQIEEMNQQLFEAKRPYALIIRKDAIGDFPLGKAKVSSYPLSRTEAIRIATEFADEKTLILSTTGMPSRELFAIRDHPSHLYLMGSMGHAMAVGCGLATERPDFRVLVLDGDGSALMHLGTLSTIGHYRPKNFLHLILDNESYESTGNQDSTSDTTDLAAIARACGYASGMRCEEEGSYRQALQNAFSQAGPHFIHVKINRDAAERLPRLTTKYTAAQLTENFLNHIKR